MRAKSNKSLVSFVLLALIATVPAYAGDTVDIAQAIPVPFKGEWDIGTPVCTAGTFDSCVTFMVEKFSGKMRHCSLNRCIDIPTSPKPSPLDKGIWKLSGTACRGTANDDCYTFVTNISSAVVWQCNVKLCQLVKY